MLVKSTPMQYIPTYLGVASWVVCMCVSCKFEVVMVVVIGHVLLFNLYELL